MLCEKVVDGKFGTVEVDASVHIFVGNAMRMLLATELQLSMEAQQPALAHSLGLEGASSVRPGIMGTRLMIDPRVMEWLRFSQKKILKVATIPACA